MSKEPALTIGAVAGLISAFFVMLGTFGVAVSDAQQDSIQKFVTAAAPFVILGVSWLIRQRVVSPNSAGKAVAQAKLESPNSTVVPSIDVKGFKAAASDALQRDEADIKWRPQNRKA